MTAIVGILNKRAAVIAADSALTVNHGETNSIYNDASKMFQLSDTNPVGVMLYNSVEFMGTPWDVIINMYRKSRGNKKYDTLKEYVNSFINFIQEEPMLKRVYDYSNYLLSEMHMYYKFVHDEVVDAVKAEVDEMDGPVDDQTIDELLSKYLRTMFAQHVDTHLEHGTCSQLEKFTLKDFRKCAADEITKLMELMKEEGLPDDMRSEWEEALYGFVRSQLFAHETGLVFVGFGETEIYPSLISIKVSGIVDGKLLYTFSEEDETHISNDCSATIMPFAQTDVMLTMMKGIAPSLFNKSCDKVEEITEMTRDRLVEQMKAEGVPETAVAKIQEIDLSDINNDYCETMHGHIHEDFVEGLVDAVDSFNIENMANMAESLISITNLQRHITSSEETVGGPIDVAVITRADGFSWIKHKQWNKNN
ncbi:MAG: hypothetical protein MJY90_02270 [Bacteroidaceae bacterium]|nr:hypothetical protein [Bacteroidaceae bacterium]